jgi:hypothetical protein
MSIAIDVKLAQVALSHLPPVWEGKRCILELKRANYNWKQMEWWGFYFEFLCRQNLAAEFVVPGDQYGRTRTACFDAKRTINWDFKAKAIKSDDHRSILNDVTAMDASIKQYGAHGLIVALCDVEYNDIDRTFQKWHAELKGGKSKYEVEREQRISISRYRKTSAVLQEVLFLIITSRNVATLDIHHQGRNSNGLPRPPKYMLDFDKAEKLIAGRLKF